MKETIRSTDGQGSRRIDLAYVKLVGRVLSGGDPWARASEAEVSEFFARFHPWGALAGAYALRAGLGGGLSGAARRLAA